LDFHGIFVKFVVQPDARGFVIDNGSS